MPSQWNQYSRIYFRQISQTRSLYLHIPSGRKQTLLFFIQMFLSGLQLLTPPLQPPGHKWDKPWMEMHRHHRQRAPTLMWWATGLSPLPVIHFCFFLLWCNLVSFLHLCLFLAACILSYSWSNYGSLSVCLSVSTLTSPWSRFSSVVARPLWPITAPSPWP